MVEIFSSFSASFEFQVVHLGCDLVPDRDHHVSLLPGVDVGRAACQPVAQVLPLVSGSTRSLVIPCRISASVSHRRPSVVVGRQNHTIEALADREDPKVHVLELVLL